MSGQIIRGTDPGPTPANPTPVPDGIGATRITTNPPTSTSAP